MSYAAAGVALLRAPVLALPPLANDTLVAGTSAEARLTEAATNPVLRSAITAANERLGAVLDDAAKGHFPGKPSRLRRAALAVTGYEARLHGRATPHGLFAGVSGVRFADRVAGSPHLSRAVVRPDQQWLVGVVGALEQELDVLITLSIRSVRVAERGDRLIAARRLITNGEATVADQEVSVRKTPAVHALLTLTRRWLPVVDVIGWLATEFGLERDESLGVVRSVVSAGLLRTNLLPDLSSPDPLGDLVAALRGHDIAEHAAELGSVAELMRKSAIEVDLRSELDERMRSVPGAGGSPSRIDLCFDGDVSISHAVAREAESVAELLSAMFTRAPSTTVRLREWFLNTHGVDRLVPLRDLLDEAACPPIGALLDAAEASADAPPWRLRMLADLHDQAVRNGVQSVTLDAAVAAAMADADHVVPPVSVDLFTRLVARDQAALADGEFMLIEPRFGPGPAGATFTRFEHVMSPQILEDLGTAVRAVQPWMEKAVYAEVSYSPTYARIRNVLRAPRWTDHRIVVDGDATETTDIDVDDLLVGATSEGMYLVSRRLGVPVVPVAHSRVNKSLAPAAVRLLLAIGADDGGEVHGWSWGPLTAAPFLPRVTVGRTVLTTASWRLPGALIDAADVDDDTWLARLAAWREEAGVPQRVLVGVSDRRVPLDLARRWHGLLLRREISARQVERVCEFIGDGGEDGWFSESDGPHVTELVIPMLAARQQTRPSPSRVHRVIGRADGALHLPGGEYLSIELDVPRTTQNAVLAHLRTNLQIPMDVAAVDRWFFLRYHRVGYISRPHLRLRFHGDPRALAGTLLPAWHDIAERLQGRGMSGEWRIVPYDQEVERYGGPQLFTDVERLFDADSEAVIRTLRAEQPGLIGVAVTAVSAAEIVIALDPDGADSRWLSALHGHAEIELRPEVRALVANGELPGRLGPDIAAAWAERRRRAEALGRRIRQVESTGGCWSPPARIFESIVHLHCNRMAGIAPELEHRALLLARDAMQARRQSAVSSDA